MNIKKDIPCEGISIFDACHIYVFPTGLGKKRLSLFERQIGNHGGKLVTPTSGNLSATHIVVDDSVTQDLEKFSSYLRSAKLNYSETAKFIRIQWLSKCLKENKCVDTTEFEVSVPKEINIKKSIDAKNSTAEDKIDDLDSVTASRSDLNKSRNEEYTTQELSYIIHYAPPKKLKVDMVQKFACSQASSKITTGCNQLITSELQKLADAFRSSGDQWRAYGYDKAISAIKAHNKEITNFEEAVTLRGLGQKMAAKVCEILEFGKLRKVEEICNTEKMKVVDLFTKVWGAGPSTAEGWYLQGYRTLEDLNMKANLTKQQKIGMKHFDDIQDRMTRQEVERIGTVVREAALVLEPTLTVMLCGSYRRGKDTCGDVDVLISKDDRVTGDIFTRLLAQLKESGFITDDLVGLEVNGNQKKYLGVCRLPGESQRHRRLDIFVVPQAEFATSLMHYTGSAVFNRSIRLLASKKGMSLSEHSLVAGVVRQGREKLNGGYVIPTPTEESIFQHLELQYRPPEERDH